jgi:GT2 family glycosyltransferase
MPELSVVIGSYNRLPFLRATLASLRDELDQLALDHEILVVDGGSDDGTIRWLTGQKDVIAIVQHNRGTWRGRPLTRRSWGGFMNLGFRAAGGTHVCMLSDDCLVVPGAIAAGLAEHERRAAAGERIGAVAFYWRDWPSDAEYRVGLTFGGRMFVNHGLFLREALEDVGFVDESLRFYHADGDLALRMAENGWACVDSPQSYVEHYLDAAPAVRASNLATQQADWAAYRERWERLGAPDRDWILRAHEDRHGTARRYWGRRRTSPNYRRAVLAVHAARSRAT